MAVEMLSAVALINQTLDAKDMGAFYATLISPAAGLGDIDDSLMQRCDFISHFRGLILSVAILTCTGFFLSKFI